MTTNAKDDASKLTKRELFALELAKVQLVERFYTVDTVPQEAVRFADILIKELNKETK